MSPLEAKQRIGSLSSELKQHNYNYYVLAMPTISDFDFDKKLEELGIVKGKRIKVDLKRLGYDITAFVGIYLEKSSLYDTVATELKNIPEIVRLNYTTGNYSMFIEVVCKDINQLRSILHDELQKIKGIERTETFISLDEGFNRNVQIAPKEE
jgi:Lrp/AsnC family transcriptional regulator for asnA, asnC and gidA